MCKSISIKREREAHTEVSHEGDMDYVRILRDLREDADKTQTQIAEVLGTSQTMYARYERGANELPIRHLISLCRLYNISADYFLDTEPDPRRRRGIR